MLKGIFISFSACPALDNEAAPFGPLRALFHDKLRLRRLG
jgi:hypothetical protein